MRRRSTRTRPAWIGPELAWVVATAFVAALVAFFDLKLWRMDPDVPLFAVEGDSSYYLASIKGVLENGWFLHNPDLGAPFGQSNHDFAIGDVVHYALVWLLGLVLGDPVIVFNAFFLLCFPLIAVVSYAVLRDLGAARAPALVAGVLFAFLPYHMIRGQDHLFLTSYYEIPLAIWLVVMLAEGRSLIGRGVPRGRTLLIVGACLVVGAGSSYYAIFALLVLLTVVASAAIARRSRAIALQGVATVALVVASFALANAPAFVDRMQNGANEVVAARGPGESELYGLKLADMVIPRNTHRVDVLAGHGQAYYAQTPLRSEGFNPALGSVATFGLLAALLVLLATGIASATASLRRSRIAVAGTVALMSFLIGTIGGGSALIAYELTPQLRAWNRLALFIAFASLIAVALLLTALGERLRARARPAWLAAVIAAFVGVLGVYDQTSEVDAPDYAAVATAWKANDDFATRMQDRFPAGTKILQLPYMSYPEHGPIHALGDYDLFTGYLHTTDLRWTYGAIRGDLSDWHGAHQALPPDQLATAAAAAGFGAVYLDRIGYADGGAATAAALGALTGSGASGRSADGRLQFFDLRPVAARLAASTTPAEREQLSQALLYPVKIGFGDGFSYAEHAGPTPFRWAGTDARLTLESAFEGTRDVPFTVQLFGGRPEPSTVTLTLPGGSRRSLQVTDKGRKVSLVLRLRGEATLRLQTVGPPAPHPPDNVRDLRLRVQDPRIEYAPLQPARLTRYVASATP
jgi:phosphoglycerol transferase